MKGNPHNSAQIGLPGVLSALKTSGESGEMDGFSRLARFLVEEALAQSRLDSRKAQQGLRLDTRTVHEALAAVDANVLSLDGRYSPKYVDVSRLAIRYAVETVGDVVIADLGPDHVTRVWNHLVHRPNPSGRKTKPGASLSCYGSALMGRLVDAEKLGFVGMKRWREMWPRIPTSARKNIAVSDALHREAIACVRWAAEHTTTTRQMLRLLEVMLRSPFRVGELCSLRPSLVDHRASVARLERSKTGPREVPMTRRSCKIVLEQLADLGHDARLLWPSDSRAGHILVSSASHAWARIRADYAAAQETALATSLRDARLHDTRGVIGTQAANHGGSSRDVQTALGHQSEKTTLRYMHGASMRGAVVAVQRVEDVLDREDDVG